MFEISVKFCCHLITSESKVFIQRKMIWLNFFLISFMSHSLPFICKIGRQREHFAVSTSLPQVVYILMERGQIYYYFFFSCVLGRQKKQKEKRK